SSAYEKESSKTLLSLTPYVRQNTMEYIANWSLSYDPTRLKTESDSVGLLAKYRMDFDANRTRLIIGADIDYTPGNRIEHSIDAVRNVDRIYESYTVDEKIYDYDVTYQGISPYVHVETSPLDKLRITAGLRYDNMTYDYEDNMPGAPVDYTVNIHGVDSTKTYNRPGDAKVDFSHLSPKLGATYSFTDRFNGFVSYRHAFRAPSEGQIFRPGANAASLNLDAVKVNSYEVGVRGEPDQDLNYEVSLYYMSKKDDLVSYDDGAGNTYAVNAGETLHKGIELGMNSKITQDLSVGMSYSRSSHTYEDWVVSGTDFSGNDIESAPDALANVRINYRPAVLKGGRAELEWVHMGEYLMDQANSVDPVNTTIYDGHNLLNVRINYFVDKNFELFARLLNAGDERYATASKYTPAGWGPAKSEFAPGMPRTVYAGVEYKF
ncbi:MAG: TonB-dependent receptor, partial [Gammaproteobacteria bacterium]|nr:TonB-dependent receptor [Gammaproteobacteria bacterium]